MVQTHSAGTVLTHQHYSVVSAFTSSTQQLGCCKLLAITSPTFKPAYSVENYLVISQMLHTTETLLIQSLVAVLTMKIEIMGSLCQLNVTTQGQQSDMCNGLTQMYTYLSQVSLQTSKSTLTSL
ncbi:hypothetical protein C437_18347 [Haloarcula vallismortis ATCC 29715]|uniref:Uncharacterized protein n=1 Tax=Haloarcula vallismortis ATCC 29715 TaxID=662477 RepID=M0IVM3_HALVA|nr:hypothetical protein C437_18347 [Haloarcula vallismortis ATCC 29715]